MQLRSIFNYGSTAAAPLQGLVQQPDFLKISLYDMLDQSFSTHNFEFLFNLENRKGNIDIKSMSQPYQDVLAEIKDKNEQLRELRKKKKADRTSVEYEEIEMLESELKQLRIKKSEALVEDMSSIAEEVNRRHFSLTIDKHNYGGKEEFTLKESRASFYAMKQLMYNMKRTFKIEMPGRHQIMASIKHLLNMKMPIFIIRTDINSFYESIPQEHLLQKVYDNSLLSLKSKSFIKQVFQAYESIKDFSLTPAGVGIPRGIGISAMLSEVYMQDIDQKIKSRTEVIYYARYVDDIFIIFTSLVGHKSLNDYYKNLQKEFKSIGLELKSIGDSKCKLIAYRPDAFKDTPFAYLGYKLKLSKPSNELKTVYSLSDKKIDKLNDKIHNAFKHFETLSKKDIKTARRDLLDSLDYITGNTRLSNSKKYAKTGLYYNNVLLDDLSELDHFTQLLHQHPISPNHGSFSNSAERQKFIIALQKRIAKIDFKQRWEERKMFKFSMARISEISSWL